MTEKEKIMAAALKDTDPSKTFKDKIYDGAFAAGRSDGFQDGYSAGKASGDAALTKLKADVEAAQTLEEKAKQEWDKTPALREEFASLGIYVAFLKANESGKVRILGKGK